MLREEVSSSPPDSKDGSGHNAYNRYPTESDLGNVTARSAWLCLWKEFKKIEGISQAAVAPIVPVVKKQRYPHPGYLRRVSAFAIHAVVAEVSGRSLADRMHQDCDLHHPGNTSVVQSISLAKLVRRVVPAWDLL